MSIKFHSSHQILKVFRTIESSPPTLLKPRPPRSFLPSPMFHHHLPMFPPLILHRYPSISLSLSSHQSTAFSLCYYMLRPQILSPHDIIFII